jgi:hypothetical protein
MNARRLIIAVALPVLALPVVALAAVRPGEHHSHQELSSGQQADGGPLLRQPAGQDRGGSGGHSASSRESTLSDGTSLSGTKRTKIVSVMANVDYASGGYGQYNPAALHDSWVQGVVINVDWRYGETSLGRFNWAPLDRTATTWADAGKHVALVVRAANEIGGGCSATGWGQMLPGWEITALHKSLGRIGTFCDKDVNGLVPDWFSATFQSDWRAFIRALGAHVSAKSYYSSISYVRIGVGLGGEGFALMPQRAGNRNFSADQSWMETHWHYSTRAWQNFQETMLAVYDAAFPSPVPVIYPLDDFTPRDTENATVAKWATSQGGIGIGEECLPPGGLNASFGAIDRWVRDNHPNAYIQFQTCGQTTTARAEQGIIKAAEGYGAKSIEWYQSTIARPPSDSAMTAYQAWVNSSFGK